MFHRNCLCGLALLAAIAISPTACAALGGNVDSVLQDRVQVRATARTDPGTNYTVHELLAPSGTTVREYAATSGQVFAVSWSGPSMPDLRQLLGGYFTDYTTNHRGRQGGHARRGIDRSDLVVHSTGHMRAFSGKAYLPSLIPAGVAIDDLP